MEAKEISEKFADLYEMMKANKKVCDMKIFGGVMREMLEWFAINKPDLAEEWLGKLESIKWNNYLTDKEAEEIVETMTPNAAWSKDTLTQGLQKMNLPKEEAPYFNFYALFATMSMVYSDSARTIASIMNKSLAEVDEEAMMDAVYKLAIDKLKDADKIFSVRAYFGI